ncbi:hypothetical protein E2C01_001367 [Portunus trituberculatus]|uniref:Uncharacterized protein n=1 Tax=Portunus trituberculatus TaxID=210409 RepID=A0A5B7CJ82_PORTR|nr:hypothetical protein [Portunus trituberculatus]
MWVLSSLPPQYPVKTHELNCSTRVQLNTRKMDNCSVVFGYSTHLIIKYVHASATHIKTKSAYLSENPATSSFGLSVLRRDGDPQALTANIMSQMCSFSFTNSKIFSTSTPHFQTFLRDVTR